MYINFFLPSSYTGFYTSYRVMQHAFLFVLVSFRYGIRPFSSHFIIFGKHVFLVALFVSSANLFDVLLIVFFIGWLAGWLGVLVGAVLDGSSFLLLFGGGLRWFYLYIWWDLLYGGRVGRK